MNPFLNPTDRQTLCVLALIASVLTAGPLAAQPNVSAPEVAAQQLELRRVMSDPYMPPQEPTGEDLIILYEHKPFYLSFESLGSWTSNAFLSNVDKTDFYTSNTISFGFETLIAERYSIQIGPSISFHRYSKFSQLDYETIGGQVRFSVPYPSWEWGVEYRPTAIYSRSFDEHSVTLHDLSGFIAGQHSLTETTGLFGEGRLSRVFADPDDFNVTRISLSGGFFAVLQPGLSLTLGVALIGSYYDDYFEDDLGGARYEMLVSPVAQITWQPCEQITLSASLRYSHNESSIGQLDYDEVAFMPRISITIRF